MLDEGLFQLHMFAGVERKRPLVLHEADQPVHGFHIVQIYQDAPVDDQETAVIFQKLLNLGKGHAAAVFFLCIDHAVIGAGQYIADIRVKNRNVLLVDGEIQVLFFFRKESQGVPDRLFHLLQIERFDQIIEGVAAEGIWHVFQTAGEKDQDGVGVFFPELQGSVDTAGRPHVNIHEDQTVAGCLESL